MRVSVLMAVYNGASSVRAAIASIAAQTYEDWELIIVDDGSTDSTLSTLEIIAATDPRIHILHNTRNRGLAASLNTARKYAHGDLLARMDADDVSHPERFQCQVQFMATHPEVDVLGTGLEMVSAAGTTLGCLQLGGTVQGAPSGGRGFGHGTRSGGRPRTPPGLSPP